VNSLIRKLENEKRHTNRLINSLKVLNISRGAFPPEALAEFETLDEAETFERYWALSKREDWSTMLAYGNWEDFNNESRCIVPVEKQFIRNRLKHGGKALVAVTKEWPNTSQIVDYNHELDNQEDRKSVSIEDVKKPVWVNVFEGNNFVHIWNLNSRDKVVSTFMDCKPVADFYKDFIYGKVTR